MIDDGVNEPVIDYSEVGLYIQHYVPDEVRITASDPGEEAFFGYTVSISGDYAIVGANGGDGGAERSGAAYIYKNVCREWIEVAKLTASDAALYDSFGVSVAIDGDYAVVGACGDDDNGDVSGSAYIFRRMNEEGTEWVEQAKLTASDGESYNYFGYAVSIHGEYAIVGADGNNDSMGAAYLFKRDGETWTEQAKLVASDAEEQSMFGWSVSINGEFAIVGAVNDGYYDGYYDGYPPGAAYIFKQEGDTWIEQIKLTAFESPEQYRFGYSVDINENHAVVGAVGNYVLIDEEYEMYLPGAAFIYEYEEGAWVGRTKVMSDNPQEDDNFGISVSIDSPYVVVGRSSEDYEYDDYTAYVYESEGDIWFYRFKLETSEYIEGDFHGYSVSIDNNRVIVGAYGDSELDDMAGASYIYELGN